MVTYARRAPLWWLLALAWAGGIFVLSSQSTLPSPAGLNLASAAVLGHLIAYSVLSALLVLALARSGLSLRRATLLAVLLATLYGLSDEFHQSFVPGRDASLGDLAVDFVAACLASAVMLLSHRVARR